MCARFTLTAKADSLHKFFGLSGSVPPLQPRYNIAPSQVIAVIGLKPDGQTRGLAQLQWGFVPYWAHDPRSGPKPVNARVETVATKPPFEHAFREKRCLIPADGFFEWAAEDGKKVPHHFRLKSGEPFAFAGVWDAWMGGEKPLLTCALITVPANEVVRPFHDRMPAMLLPEQYDRWLGPNAPESELLSLLVHLPADLMEAVRVSQAVNKATNDSPECLVPAACPQR